MNIVVEKFHFLGGSESISVTGKVRERAFEILYEEDNDHLCLSTMILDAILQVDRDLRQKVAENLVLVGGTTMAPGFKARLKEELEKQLKFDRYKKLNIQKFAFHALPCKENYAAWLGGKSLNRCLFNVFLSWSFCLQGLYMEQQNS